MKEITIAIMWETRLWDAANAIVAFSVAQSLVAAYALGKKELQSSLSKPVTLRIAIGWQLFVTGVQIAAVLMCLCLATDLTLDDESLKLWKWFTAGRSIGIALFSLAPLTGFLMLRKLHTSR